MSWFKKLTSSVGIIMTSSSMTGITYDELVREFGEPNDVEKHGKIATEARWKLQILGTKIQIQINSSDWLMNHWPEGEKSAPVPSIENPKVDEIKILGDREKINFIQELIYMIINNDYSSSITHQAIKKAFTEM